MEKKKDILIEICAQLAEEEKLLSCAVYESAKGAGVIGISALLGGFFGGRQGLLIGGAIGSAAGFLMASDFKSIPKLIREDMTDHQRETLYKRINALFKDVVVNDVASTMQILAKNINLKTNVLSVLSDYLKNDLGLNLQ